MKELINEGLLLRFALKWGGSENMICKAWELRTYNLEDLLLSKYL